MLIRLKNEQKGLCQGFTPFYHICSGHSSSPGAGSMGPSSEGGPVTRVIRHLPHRVRPRASTCFMHSGVPGPSTRPHSHAARACLASLMRVRRVTCLIPPLARRAHSCLGERELFALQVGNAGSTVQLTTARRPPVCSQRDGLFVGLFTPPKIHFQPSWSADCGLRRLCDDGHLSA